MARRSSGDLLLLAIGAGVLWKITADKAAATAQASAAAAATRTPGISPNPAQHYTTPSGGPRWGGTYSPYAGYRGQSMQPGSQTGKFYG